MADTFFFSACSVLLLLLPPGHAVHRPSSSQVFYFVVADSYAQRICVGHSSLTMPVLTWHMFLPVPFRTIRLYHTIAQALKLSTLT